MIQIGRSVRWFNDYYNEILFSHENQFDFMQIWFRNGALQIDTLAEPIESYIKQAGYPIIIHAVFEPDDFDKYGNQLIGILNYLGHKELILHPVCTQKPIDNNSIDELSANIKKFNKKLMQSGIQIYVENNSKIDPIFYKPEEIKILFEENPEAELLLDLAHIDSYEHLEKIAAIRKPKILHIADKRFSQEHEHLPIGQGELDFKLIFEKYLVNFSGKVIMEIVYDNETVIASKKALETIFQEICG